MNKENQKQKQVQEIIKFINNNYFINILDLQPNKYKSLSKNLIAKYKIDSDLVDDILSTWMLENPYKIFVIENYENLIEYAEKYHQNKLTEGVKIDEVFIDKLLEWIKPSKNQDVFNKKIFLFDYLCEKYSDNLDIKNKYEPYDFYKKNSDHIGAKSFILTSEKNNDEISVFTWEVKNG